MKMNEMTQKKSPVKAVSVVLSIIWHFIVFNFFPSKSPPLCGSAVLSRWRLKRVFFEESEEGFLPWSDAEEGDCIANLAGLYALIYFSKSRVSIDLQKRQLERERERGERRHMGGVGERKWDRQTQQGTDKSRHGTDRRKKGREAIRQWEGKLQRPRETFKD